MKKPDNPRHLLFGGIFVLANKLQVVGDKEVEGLSAKQWFLLRNIIEMPQNPPPTVTQIAAEMDTTRQNIAKMLEAAGRDGMVSLTTNAQDRRSHDVKITDKGKQYVAQSDKNAQLFLNNLFAGIEQEKLDIAGGVVVKMLENLQAMQDA